MGSGSPLDALIFHLCLYYSCFSPFPGPCHPNPCHNNGECQLVPNRGDVFTEYICKCPAGYDGVHCQNSEYIEGQAGEACPLRAWGVCAAVTVWGTRLCQGSWAVLELAEWREPKGAAGQQPGTGTQGSRAGSALSLWSTPRAAWNR